MRVLVIVKADNNSGRCSSRQEILEKMSKYNEGTGEGGRHAGRRSAGKFPGKRVEVLGDKQTITLGPIRRDKELIAGFWL